jgi:hypothetical protein
MVELLFKVGGLATAAASSRFLFASFVFCCLAPVNFHCVARPCQPRLTAGYQDDKGQSAGLATGRKANAGTNVYLLRCA